MFHVEHHAKRGQGGVVVVRGLHPRSISTTSTIRLAQLFAFASESCLLIDLGPRGDATRRLGASLTQSGLLAAILSGDEPGGRLGLLARSVAPGLDLIPYDLALESLDPAGVGGDEWAQTLQEFSGQYTWILIDCPPGNTKLATSCLKVADQVILTTTETKTLDLPDAPEYPQAVSRTLWGRQEAPQGDLDLDRLSIPEDANYLRPENSNWDDLEVSLEGRATRAYVALAKELRSGG